MIRYLSNLRFDPTFDPIQNDLNSSGSIRLIDNKKLKSLLSNWTSDIIAVKEGENSWSKTVHQQIRPTFRSLGLSRELDNTNNNKGTNYYLLDESSYEKGVDNGKSKLGASLTEIRSNRIIESLASSATSFNRNINLQSKTLHQRITLILHLIHSEITKDHQ